MSNLDKWASELQKEVYQTWKEKYLTWKPGFKVFYGPVKQNPELMIVSQNPGGGANNFKVEDLSRFQIGDFSPQQEHAYKLNHTLATTLRNLFDDKTAILYKAVTFPMIFFRSRSTKELSGIERFMYHEMERYSLLKAREIIQKVKPQKIFVIGFKSHDLLERTLGLFDSEEFLHMKKDGRLLARIAQKDGISIFSSIHISGARLNNNEKLFLKKELHKFLET